MKLVNIVGCIAVAAMAAGCVAVPVGPGDKEGAVPPKLTIKDNAKIWDNPGAFGPVPAALEKAGQQVCSSMDTKDWKFKAVGYHSKAQDVDGKALPNGGYLCVVK